ncbi:MAG: translation initiation factor IF-2, translation initiation factor 5B [archaeon GW2011_AR11]|nr:MAG: translation initiation factor IF-2, translation initiation factor 5B [archaeon GW2011_AR11]
MSIVILQMFKNAFLFSPIMLRQPILVFMGNVDAGKTQLLDTIRSTAIVAKEAGGITQAIGASIIPLASIQKICGQLLGQSAQLIIPGILTIDTPGHAAFTNMRRRGGNLADMAVLVIDIREGVKPQTVECIGILKQYKIPFVIALNKVDLLNGWQPHPETMLMKSIGMQGERVITELETRLYEVVAQLNGHGLNADRFDRVSDYTKQLAVVPTSAKTGEGIPELLMVLIGLSQKYLEKNLAVDKQQPARGTVIEVKEEKGLGTTMDAIIYDGTLKVGDTLVIGTLGDPVTTRVKALLEPAPLSEMRDRRSKFAPVKEVFAATGVKITATGIENVVAGMPLRSCSPEGAAQVAGDIKQEVEEVLLETDAEGIVVKADSLGSLEAVVKLFREHGIKIKKASIGPITRKDCTDCEANLQHDPLTCVLIGFNVPILQQPSPSITVITGDVIYRLIEQFEAWVAEQKKRMQAAELDVLIKPCKIRLLRGYVFRQNNPAVVGVEVMAGILKTGTPLMKKDGNALTEVKAIQDKQENLAEARKEQQVAVSLPGVTIGRQLHEEDILYSAIPESQFKKYKDFRKQLTPDEREVLREIADIMRGQDPMWGI